MVGNITFLQINGINRKEMLDEIQHHILLEACKPKAVALTKLNINKNKTASLNNPIQAEINKTQEAIKKVTGFTPTLFRPTYGGYNNTLKSYTDLKFVLWDVDSRDWQAKTKDKILKNVLPNVKSGSIILLHDNHEYSLNSLDDILKNLKNQGYKFVTVTELLELKKLRESE